MYRSLPAGIQSSRFGGHELQFMSNVVTKMAAVPMWCRSCSRMRADWRSMSSESLLFLVDEPALLAHGSRTWRTTQTWNLP
jgi:hypothetical protein